MKLAHTSALALCLTAAPLAGLAGNHSSGNSDTSMKAESGAQTAGAPGALCLNSFSIVDANEDGTVSMDEAEESAANRFATIDANDDGTLTREEYVACMTQNAGQTATPMDRTPADLAALDDDGNGKITFDEWVNTASGAYARVTGEDFTPEDERRAEQLTYTREDGEVAPRIGEMTDAEYWSRVADMFAMFDADNSGEVTESEWTADQVEMADMSETYEREFSQMDANEDGAVSEQEFAAESMRTYEEAMENIPGQTEAANADGLPGVPVMFYRYYIVM